MSTISVRGVSLFVRVIGRIAAAYSVLGFNPFPDPDRDTLYLAMLDASMSAVTSVPLLDDTTSYSNIHLFESRYDGFCMPYSQGNYALLRLSDLAPGAYGIRLNTPEQAGYAMVIAK